MEYYTLVQLARGAFVFFLSGLMLGVIYALLSYILSFLGGILHIPQAVVTEYRKGRGWKALRNRFTLAFGTDSGVRDLMCALLACAVFILTTYVMQDGEFRLYSLVLMLGGIYLMHRLFSYCPLYVVTVPLNILYGLIIRLAFALALILSKLWHLMTVLLQRIVKNKKERT